MKYKIILKQRKRESKPVMLDAEANNLIELYKRLANEKKLGVIIDIKEV